MANHWSEVMAGEAPDFTFEGEGECVLRARGVMLHKVETLSAETPRQDATAGELDALFEEWRGLVLRALTHPRTSVSSVSDKDSIKSYIVEYKDDARWVTFLSINMDRGDPLPQAAQQLNIPGDYRMAKSLLLPGEEESEGAVMKSVKYRLLELLRKTGTGRRLCVNEEWGLVVLVPAESVVGDEIWAFRGTDYQYVLREVEQGKYVVIGEACKY
jgi:hypothetical protein